MIAIQVAAGIVLAYVVIVNQAAILRSIKWLTGAIFGIAVIGLIIWGASETVSALSPYSGKFISKAVSFVGVVLILIVAAAGGGGLWMLWNFWRKSEYLPKSDEAQFAMLLFMSVTNVFLVWLATSPVLTYSLAGQWYNPIDQWSRANGHADGGAIAVASLFWLWPYVPLCVIWKRRAKGAPAVADQRTTHTD